MPLLYLLVGFVAGITLTSTEIYKRNEVIFDDKDVERELELECIRASNKVEVEGLYWDPQSKDYFADIVELELDNLILAKFVVQHEEITYNVITLRTKPIISQPFNIHAKKVVKERVRPILVTEETYLYLQRCLA
jgi:hypothetical protein